LENVLTGKAENIFHKASLYCGDINGILIMF